MAVDVMRSFQLDGAPDDIIGTPEAKSSAVQVMQIDLTQEVLDELLACTRSGKPPQILFGKNPRLEVGEKLHVLDTSVEHNRHELYRYDTDLEEGEEQPWTFAGLVNHALEIRRVEEKTMELDQAMEDLKYRMQSNREQKEASKTVITTELATVKPPRKSGHLRTPSLLNSFKHSSRPNSPSLSAVGSPALAPTSEPLDDEHKIKMATQKAVAHFLAVKPRTLDEVVQKTKGRQGIVEMLLSKVGKKDTSDSGEEKWKLTDSAYKNLDIWDFRYGDNVRKMAQENAIRAFDRLRIPKTDKLWQSLLPEVERGKGKCLSRLGDLSQGPRGGTPMVKAQKIDKKTGLPKKDPPKKERKEKEKKSEDDEDKEKEKAPVADQGKKGSGHDRSGKESSTKLSTKRHATPSDRTPLASKPSKSTKMVNGPTKSNGTPKPSSQQVSKPKNPSPLGSSPPTNASDMEDDGPVRLPPTSSPAKKRKADEERPGVSPAPKARKLDTSSQARHSATPHSRTPSQKLNGVTKPTHKPVNGPSHTNGGAQNSSSDSPSPELQLSWRQTIELAAKFKRYYERYEKLYHQLADNPEPPTQESRQELMKMHERLGEMKSEISAGSLRG